MNVVLLLFVCTFAFPHAGLTEAIQIPSCPRDDIGNDSELTNYGFGTQRCVRRFKV